MSKIPAKAAVPATTPKAATPSKAGAAPAKTATPSKAATPAAAKPAAATAAATKPATTTPAKPAAQGSATVAKAATPATGAAAAAKPAAAAGGKDDKQKSAPAAAGAVPGGSTPSSKSSENVTVCVRIRPMNQLEIRTSQAEAWTVKNNNFINQTYIPSEGKEATHLGRAVKAPVPLSYSFDHIFTNDKNNQFVFDSVGKRVVHSVMSGYHGCIFAYGQTSSGKTYTIHGTQSDPGMIPQSVEAVFQYIESSTDREFVLRVSYLEIYNEMIADLLDPLNTNLRIRETEKKGVFVEHLKEDIVMSPDQVFSLLAAGESHRHIGRTNYNEVSSRAHTIFRIVIESTSRTSSDETVRVSTLNLVDLAGSENAVKAGSASRIKETGYINKSLLTLGHVIWKLTEKAAEHIPYRDSKLTRILQTSLDGSSLVAVVCNMSPSSGNLEETISTLKFANRAKRVRNNAEVNEISDETALLRQYREEIDRLKRELTQLKEAAATKGPAPAAAGATPAAGGAAPANAAAAAPTANELALKAQIEQLTRLILTSQTVKQEKTSTHTAPPEALLPYFKPKTGKAGAAPGKTDTPDMSSPKGHAQAEALKQSPHMKGLVFTEPPVPPESDPGYATAMKLLVVTLRRQSEDKDEAMYKMLDEIKKLKEKIEEQEKTLEEWDNYFVATRNKHTAIESRMRAIDPETADAVAGEDEKSGASPPLAAAAENPDHLMDQYKMTDFHSPLVRSESVTGPVSPAAGKAGTAAAGTAAASKAKPQLDADTTEPRTVTINGLERRTSNAPTKYHPSPAVKRTGAGGAPLKEDDEDTLLGPDTADDETSDVAAALASANAAIQATGSGDVKPDENGMY